jgi:hypothetical protein
MSKQAIPVDLALRFSAIVNSMIEPFGISEIPEAMKYIVLMDQEIMRHVHGQSLPEDVKGKHKERAAFILLFQNKYRKRFGYDYDRKVSPADAKLIVGALERLEKKNITIDEYLGWIFEVFLERNQERAVNISGVAGNYPIDAFIASNRELIERKMKEGVEGAERLAFVNRINVLRRKFRGTDKEAGIESLVKEYKERKISFEGLKSKVIVMEKMQ